MKSQHRQKLNKCIFKNKGLSKKSTVVEGKDRAIYDSASHSLDVLVRSLAFVLNEMDVIARLRLG